MGIQNIQSGETKRVAKYGKGNKNIYRIEPLNGRLRMSDSRKNLDKGDRISRGSQVTVKLEENDGLWIFNPTDGTVKVSVTEQGLIQISRNQITQETVREQSDKVETDVIEATENNEELSFKNQPVAQNSGVLVEPDSTNDGEILVNGQVPLGSGKEFTTINNMNAITLEFENAKDKAFATTEASN